ncbi:hypothetical protein OBBRIDRAFT_749080, partial [Obba rivulosa]
MGDVISIEPVDMLNEMFPWPVHAQMHGMHQAEARFVLLERTPNNVAILDRYLMFWLTIPVRLLTKSTFDLGGWWYRHASRVISENEETADDLLLSIGLNAVSVSKSKDFEGLPALQRNASSPRDFKRLIPKPVVVVVDINGHPARALLDSGSLSDFMSTKLAHQLGVKTFELEKALPVHLAVQGSRAKVNVGCKAEIKYQSIKELRYFDIMNLLNYDLILGTPFWFQHQISVGLNPTSVMVGNPVSLPIEGKSVRVLESRAADIFEDELEHARQFLRDYAAPICVSSSDSPLPPLRVINHTIPLIDKDKIYHWRPSKCPDALRPAWVEKRDAYLKTGR